MNKNNNLLKNYIILLVFSLLISCSSKKVEYPNPQWTFAQSGIELIYTSCDKLNQFNGNPHTMITGVYQLSNKAGFEEISKTSQGIAALLSIKDPTKSKSLEVEGVEKVDSFIVNPGENKTLTFDRLESVKWVAILAGYYNLDPKKSVRIYKVPVIKDIKKGIFFRKYLSYPSKLYINLNFGQISITKLKES